MLLARSCQLRSWGRSALTCLKYMFLRCSRVCNALRCLCCSKVIGQGLLLSDAECHIPKGESEESKTSSWQGPAAADAQLRDCGSNIACALVKRVKSGQRVPKLDLMAEFWVFE